MARLAAQDGSLVFPSLAINLSQGVAWKALISKYMTVIPRIDEASTPVEQTIGGPPPRNTDTSARAAKVGAAARQSHSAAARTTVASRASRAPIANVVMASLLSSVLMR